MKKQTITPFKSGEMVALGCGASFKVHDVSNNGCNFNISSLVSVFGGTVILPVTESALESLKLLVKRLEKTFEKR